MYKVVLHNNDHTPFDVVIFSLISYAGLTEKQAEAKAKEIHEKGSSTVVVVDSEEAATNIQKRISRFSEDFGRLKPLEITIE